MQCKRVKFAKIHECEINSLVLCLCIQYTCLGRKLCRALNNEQNSGLAKSRIKQLVQFYRNMPCLVELARSPRFDWSVDDLLQLAAAVPRRVVSAALACDDDKFVTLHVFTRSTWIQKTRQLVRRSTKTRTKSAFMPFRFSLLFLCVFVPSPTQYVFHTPTARYRLFVLKVPLNTN